MGNGRAPSGQALAVPATPANAVDGPSGFDPSRIGCPYELTDARFDVWIDGYQAALRWMSWAAK